MKKILVLGCTGSIGSSALHCIASHPERFKLVGLSAHTKADALSALGKQFGIANLCLSGVTNAAPTIEGIKFFGIDGLRALVQETNADIVLNGISGAAGLVPSITALSCGYDLALANKETMVTAGNLVTALAKKNDCKILPVDSEHSAIFNLLERFGSNCIDSVILTASGGAFKNTPTEKLRNMKAADALKHPTWNMGKKITVDSATLANKGLEIIEACRLFALQPAQVSAVLHPQSLAHSFIRTKDGVLYAQISKPDMEHPILSALAWPECVPNSLEQLHLSDGCEMTFYKPRYEDFPLLLLAYDALKLGGRGTIAYNAANETAVSYFLADKIGFTDISRVTEHALHMVNAGEPADFDEVFALDTQSRMQAEEFLTRAVH